MRGFIILCFATLAVAAPPGYNYRSHYNNHYLSSATGASVSANFDGRILQGYQQEPLISKRFFIHSAPEEEEVDIQQRNIVIGQPRKNFNVVFIKSPIASNPKTKIRIIPAANEEKTAIYVLAKKADESDVIAHVEEPFSTTAKPEVFFIKYKTNEEAEHAQNTIQAEYDRLGGSSIISNEGIAPVSSVIGSLEANGYGAGESVGAVAEAGHGAVNNAYLPPTMRKL